MDLNPGRLAFRPFLRLTAAFALSLTTLTALGADTETTKKGSEDPLRGSMDVLESVRQQKFLRPVEQKTIRRSDLREFLRRQMQKDLPIPIDSYLRVLKSLGLVGADVDVEPLLDLYEAQVLAFYDPVSHVYYSLDVPPPSMASAAAMMEPMVVVHELMHALQDQRFDAGKRMLALQHDWDEQMAYAAVLEGEATLVMLAAVMDEMGAPFEDVIKSEELLKTFANASQGDIGVPANAPPYFVESMKFPYFEGLQFVIEAYKRGGWKELDRVHANPPASTEQVRHPELYFGAMPAGAPRTVTAPPAKTRLLDFTLGEFHWSFLLGKAAGEGWGGDLVQVLEDKAKKMTILIDSTWDSDKDATEFERAYASFLEGKHPDARLRREGRRVRVAFGADRKQIRAFIAD